MIVPRSNDVFHERDFFMLQPELIGCMKGQNWYEQDIEYLDFTETAIVNFLLRNTL